MKANYYKIIQHCIEQGITTGLSSSKKHTDTPTDEVIEIRIYDEIMINIHEFLKFEDEIFN